MSLRARLATWLQPKVAPPDVGASLRAMSVAGTLSVQEATVVAKVRPYTMTSPERIVANIDAVDYIVRREVPGTFVECGVWRGGSVMAMILTLQRLGVDDRDIYLFDTFEGMSEPTEVDRSDFDVDAVDAWEEATATGRRAYHEVFGPQAFDQAGVEAAVLATGYPRERLHFVAGKVEDTIPEAAPDHIALLRLDTDWYESTRHELGHLYPRLADGGVLLIDDYGHWEGCRRAVDEYFASSAAPELLGRVDYTGRVAVKRAATKA